MEPGQHPGQQQRQPRQYVDRSLDRTDAQRLRNRLGPAPDHTGTDPYVQGGRIRCNPDSGNLVPAHGQHHPLRRYQMGPLHLGRDRGGRGLDGPRQGSRGLCHRRGDVLHPERPPRHRRLRHGLAGSRRRRIRIVQNALSGPLGADRQYFQGVWPETALRVLQRNAGSVRFLVLRLLRSPGKL